MNITTNNFRLESSRDSNGDQALMDVTQYASSYGVAVFLRHACKGAFYLVQRKGYEGHGVHLIALPSERWLQDLLDENEWTLISKIETAQPIPQT